MLQTPSSLFRTRFAPSPTGRLHLGHAASAFLVWAEAKRADGEVLLRIEDIDTGRCRPEYTEFILQDLALLGLKWFQPVRHQSEHLAEYSRVIKNLAARDLVYRCFRTRRELPETLRGGRLAENEERAKLDAGDAFAWRLDIDRAEKALGFELRNLSWRECVWKGTIFGAPEFRNHDFSCESDPALTRKDAPAAYLLASTHDDAIQRITHVIRGEDTVIFTPLQALLQALMSWPTPIYCIHPLLLETDGKKLAKARGSKSLADYRKAGLNRDEILAKAVFV